MTSKRHTGALTPAQTRKRRRNGVSLSRAMLSSVEAPAPAHGMRVWHTNAENPRAVRKSVIPLQPDMNTVQQGHTLGEVGDVPAANPGRRRKLRRKQENDSVSLPRLRVRQRYNLLCRRKPWIGSTVGRRFSTNYCGMMAFKSIPHFLFAPTASMTLGCTGV